MSYQNLLIKQNQPQKDIDPKQYNTLIITYRQQLTQYDKDNVYQTSRQLYQQLITPIEAEIKAQNPKRLAIIATGNLRYIPFETLLNPVHLEKWSFHNKQNPTIAHCLFPIPCPHKLLFST